MAVPIQIRPDTLPEGDFPMTEQGTLLMPSAVQTEGDRIRASLAAGTYGTGQQATLPGQQASQVAGTPQVTVVAPSPMIEGNFGASGTDWAQADWGKSDQQLRDDLNLENLRSLAAQRKLNLENAPIENALKNRLTEARTAAAGVHTRYQMAQDAQALEHTHNFISAMMDPNAPAAGDPEHANYVLRNLAANPAFAKTSGGQKLLASIAAGHDVGQSITDLAANIPEGFDVSSVRAGGGKTSYIVAKPKNPEAAMAKELKTGYGLTPDQIRNPVGLAVGTLSSGGLFKGSHTGDTVQLTKGDKKIFMSTKAFERYGGQYGAETTAARSAGVSGAAAVAPGQTPAPTKHLGTYNPSTGEFDQ